METRSKSDYFQIIKAKEGAILEQNIYFHQAEGTRLLERPRDRPTPLGQYGRHSGCNRNRQSNKALQAYQTTIHFVLRTSISNYYTLRTRYQQQHRFIFLTWKDSHNREIFLDVHVDFHLHISDRIHLLFWPPQLESQMIIRLSRYYSGFLTFNKSQTQVICPEF